MARTPMSNSERLYKILLPDGRSPFMKFRYPEVNEWTAPVNSIAIELGYNLSTRAGIRTWLATYLNENNGEILLYEAEGRGCTSNKGTRVIFKQVRVTKLLGSVSLETYRRLLQTAHHRCKLAHAIRVGDEEAHTEMLLDFERQVLEYLEGEQQEDGL